jgi:hypothetical protein
MRAAFVAGAILLLYTLYVRTESQALTTSTTGIEKLYTSGLAEAAAISASNR